MHEQIRCYGPYNIPEPTGVPVTTAMTVREAERLLIMATLERTHRNKTVAAKILGITLKTLYNKLHSYGMFRRPPNDIA